MGTCTGSPARVAGNDEFERYVAVRTASLGESSSQEAAEQMFVARATPMQKSAFVAKVFGISSVQVALTALVALLVERCASQAWLQQRLWLVCLAPCGAGALIATSSLTGRWGLRAREMNYVFMVVLALAIGASLGFLGAASGWAAPALSAGITAAVLAATAGYALGTETDFLGVFPYAFASSFGLAMLGVLLLGVNVGLEQPILGSASSVLFSLYVVWKAQLVVSGRHAFIDFCLDDYAFASLTCCYLDMAGFLHAILQPPQSKKYQAGIRTL